MAEQNTITAEVEDTQAEPVLVEDVLVEEVSIDGMCGVY
jgi:mycofactocin precursor